MTRARSIRRVVFTGRNVAEIAYEALRSVFDYAERVGHWQLIGQATGPFLPFERIDLASVDGIIGFFHEQAWAQAVNAAGVAAVNISNRFADIPLPRVASDDQAVGRLGAEHLLQRGFAHFGFFGLSCDWFAQRRCEGFQSIVEAQVHRACMVFDFRCHTPDDNEAVRRWLHTLSKPVAIMAATDPEGRRLINTAADMGLRVPDDVAVLGVDNSRWLTQLVSVPMSSIEQDMRQIGHQAARMLDQLMAGEAPTPPQWIAPIGVVTRRSTDIVVAEDPLVAHALTYIRESCGCGISVDDVLDQLHISRRQFELRFKRATGQTPQVAIFRAQIEQAKKRLVETDDPMYDIAQACGFTHQPRFYVVFKRLTGMTPGEYRRRYGTLPD